MIRLFKRKSAAVILAWVTSSVAPDVSVAQAEAPWGSIVCNATEARQFTQLLDRQSNGPALALAERMNREVSRNSSTQRACLAQWQYYLGTALQLSGRLDEAGKLLEDSVSVFRTELPPSHPALTAGLNNLGAHRFWMRRYDEAAKLHEEALQLRRSALPLDDLAIADSLSNLGDSYRYLQRSAAAVPVYREAISLRSRLLSADDKLVGQSRQNLASAFEALGDMASASAELDEALRIYRKALTKDDPLLSVVLNRKAAHLFRQGNFPDAEAFYKEAATALRSISVQKLALAAVLDDFAVNQIRQRKLDEAQTLAKEALAVRRDVLPPTHPTIARTLSNLSDVAWLQARFSESLDAARQATEITLLAPVLDAAAKLRLQRHVRAAWWIDGQPRQPKDRALLEEAFVVSQHATRSGTANTIRALATRTAAGDPKLQELVKEVDDIDREMARLDAQLSEAATAPASSNVFADIRQKSTATAARKADVLALIRRDFRDYDNLVRPGTPAPAAVQQALGMDEALVSFVVGFTEVQVWAVTRDQLVMRQASIHPQDLSKSIAKLRDALLVEPTYAKQSHLPLYDLSAAHDLYKKLLGSVEDVIKSKTALIVVPSGSLTSLPFHLLVTTPPVIAQPNRQQASAYRTANWLMHRHAVKVLPSIESLLRLRAAPPPAANRKPMIAFANPLPRSQSVQVAELQSPERTIRGLPKRRGAPANAVSAATRLENLRSFLAKEPLPETVAEARSVANALNAAEGDVFVNSAATEANVKQRDLASFRMIYFATHGFVSGAFGTNEPSLALTTPDVATDVDDGLLTASEIATLRLDADLVVLSACDTAAGESPGADGLSGLARAFFHAGTRNVLVSHWSVDSIDTKALMEAMFSQIRTLPTRKLSESLRRAMASRIDGATGKNVWNAYPGRWAPFELVGAD